MPRTTPVAHALFEAVYIVEPHPPGTALPANGLPVFSLPYENDDDAERKLGRDSKLIFTAPADGDYVVCLGAGNITQWAATLPAELGALIGKDPE